MVGAAVENLQMHGRLCPTREAFKEIEYQFGLQIAHHPSLYLGIDHSGGTPGKIHSRQTQRLIHRHQEISGAQNSFLVAQRLSECLPQDDANIFHRVMLVDIEIANRFELQIKSAMMREQLQHMIEKTN